LYGLGAGAGLGAGLGAGTAGEFPTFLFGSVSSGDFPAGTPGFGVESGVFDLNFVFTQEIINKDAIVTER